MQLHSKYKEVIENIGKIKKAYFTTFNMDIEFVEKYILPPLFGDDIADNKFKVENINSLLMNKEKPDIKFFYDFNMLSNDKNKSTLVEIYPIRQQDGVFHPKVIYLQGTNATYLLVGSGNLTLSGWGRNIEAFQIVKIDNTNLHNQVLDFFDDVFILGGLKKRKEKRKIHFHNKINFIYSFKNKDNSILLENLEIEKNLQIYSPYFSELDELFGKKEFDKVEEINIVPDLIKNQKIRLKELPTDKKVSFYRLTKEDISEKNADSTNHSKVWISDTKYAIGSYNCTKQALYGRNFEASLVSSYAKKDDFDISKLTEVDNLEFTGKNEENEAEIEEEMTFTSLFRCVADYKTKMFEISEIKSRKENKKIKIILPSMKEKITYKEIENLSASTKVSIFRALVKDKIFEVYDSSDTLIYRGLIIEKNATEETRFVNSAETLDELLLSFQDEKNPTEGTNLKDRNRDVSSGDEAIYKRKKQKNNLNYFTMFTGFKNLNNSYEEIKDDTKKLESFCYSSKTSLQVTKNILLQKSNEKSLFIYLTIEELNKLIRRVNRKLPKDKKMTQLENVKIKLSKEDKAFIEAMK